MAETAVAECLQPCAIAHAVGRDEARSQGCGVFTGFACLFVRLSEREMGDTTTQRLGRVEAAILAELQRAGGMLHRDVALAAVFPNLGSPASEGDVSSGGLAKRRRASAEAAMSRAVVSLERKGLVVREVNPTTRRVLVRLRECTALPPWEEMARAEEDMGAHCMKQAAAWVTLARRLFARAVAIRAVRSVAGSEAERQADLDTIQRLEDGLRHDR